MSFCRIALKSFQEILNKVLGFYTKFNLWVEVILRNFRKNSKETFVYKFWESFLLILKKI